MLWVLKRCRQATGDRISTKCQGWLIRLVEDNPWISERFVASLLDDLSAGVAEGGLPRAIVSGMPAATEPA